MNPYQIDPAAARAKDEGDLNLLGTLHYVWTGLLGCTTIALVLYFVGIAGFIANAPSGPHGHPHDQEVVAGVMVVFGIVMAVLLVPLIVLHLLAAAGLRKRTRYTLVLVMSGFTCLNFPLGTGLGIWTIMVLMRPGVKALFGQR